MRPVFEHGVVVIGAGTAGLAATRRLRAEGVAVTLLEAGGRIGGRAWTGQVGGDPFDHGASWLHDAERNPLVDLAAGDDCLINSDVARRERVTLGGRLAGPDDLAAYEAAWDRLDPVVTPALAGPDVSLAAAMAPMREDPWAGLVALWEGSIIAAADAEQLGLQDWRRNRLDGSNVVPAQGVGGYVAKHLGTPAELNTAARRVRWDGAGVRVETGRGTLAAGAAVITVSTGVLAAGGIRFDPPLPGELRQAIQSLPMGLLSKIAFARPGGDRLGLDDSTLLVDRDGRMTFNVWPQGRRYIAGFVGGSAAWSVAGDAGAAEALARDELRRALGGDVVRRLGPAAVVTDWGRDPLSAGSYAFAGPGDADARGALAMAFPGQRLVFAGEATRIDGLAGTVGGAYLSGVAAAERLLGMDGGVRNA